MSEELPEIVRRYLDRHGLDVIRKDELEHIRWMMRTLDRDPLIGTFRKNLTYALHPRNLRVELNPRVHLRRRRFREHLDDHQCDKRDGFAYCEEAMRLFEALPAKDKVIIG